jgi:uncharacterized membrane protein
MYSLGRAINIIFRILNGERFRKATPDEKKNYASELNLIALLVLFFPWFMFLIEKYSYIVILLSVMGFLLPAVTIMYWNRESLPLIWNVLLSFCIIAVPIVFAVLSISGIKLQYNRTASAITFAVYLMILIFRRSIVPARKNGHGDGAVL